MGRNILINSRVADALYICKLHLWACVVHGYHLVLSVSDWPTPVVTWQPCNSHGLIRLSSGAIVLWKSHSWFCFAIVSPRLRYGAFRVFLTACVINSGTLNKDVNFTQSPLSVGDFSHNGRDGISNHQRLGSLLNRLFTPRSKKAWKLRVTGARWIPRTKDQQRGKSFHLMTSSYRAGTSNHCGKNVLVPALDNAFGAQVFNCCAACKILKLTT